MARIPVTAPAGPRVVWWAVAGAIALGAALFAVRPAVALDPHSAVWYLAGIYVAMWAVSVAPALPPAAAATAQVRVPAWIVATVGCAAVVVVRVMSHPVVAPDRRAAAIGLGLAAAIAEEAYFRRLLHGALSHLGAVVAVVAGAALFAWMHYPSYGPAAMPLDFGAGLLFGWQRWASGSWGVPAVTHALANLVASI